MYSKLKQLKEG